MEYFKYVTIYQATNATNLSFYCRHSVSPLSLWHATDSYNTLMLASNLSLFLVLAGGNSFDQLN